MKAQVEMKTYEMIIDFDKSIEQCRMLEHMRDGVEGDELLMLDGIINVLDKMIVIGKGMKLGETVLLRLSKGKEVEEW